MNKWKISTYLILVALVTGLFISSPISYAQTLISIPVEQEFNDTSGKLDQKAQTGVYILEPLEAGNPMPHQEPKHQIQLSGNETQTIDGFAFTREGTFSYRLYQQIPANKAGYTYDDQSYLITVFVTQTVEGVNVEAIVKNQQKLKVMAANFKNVYVAKSDQTEPQETERSLPNTDQNAGQDIEDERRLPSTGQLKEYLWVFGLALVLVILLFYQGKRRGNKN